MIKRRDVSDIADTVVYPGILANVRLLALEEDESLSLE